MPVVRITVPTVVNRVNVRVGDVVQCSESDARLLVRIGKAEPVRAPQAATAALLKPAPIRTDRAQRTHHKREVLAS